MLFLRHLSLLIFAAALLIPSVAEAKVTFEPFHTFDIPAWTKPTACTCLIQDSDGSYYGGATGGPDVKALIFHLLPDGSLTILHTFDDQAWGVAVQGLTPGPDGTFYGVLGPSLLYGSEDKGGIFKIDREGKYARLVTFDGSNGERPFAGMLRASDGNFYGTTGGSYYSGGGTVFRMTPAGKLTTLWQFSPSESSRLPLIQGNDGALYGVSVGDWITDNGGVFRITLSGSLTYIHRFLSSPEDPDDAFGPFVYSLVKGPDGAIYGADEWSGHYRQGTIFRVDPVTQDYRRIHDFDGPYVYPGALTCGADGPLYGYQYDSESGEGGIFRMEGDGSAFSFTPAPKSLVRYIDFLGAANDGSLFGYSSQDGKRGKGVVFRISSAHEFSDLLDFVPYQQGAEPGSLVVQADGSIYGITTGGGDHERGTFYRVAADGAYTTLASFAGPSPSALTAGPDGNFYGICKSEGTLEGRTIFRATPQGAITALYQEPSHEMADPQSPLLTLGPDGNLYGTLGLGKFFRMTPGGVLNFFPAVYDNLPGFSPENGFYAARLICGNDGSLYAIVYGGSSSAQVVRISTDGVATRLAAFAEIGEGLASPVSLLQKGGGDLYGLCFDGCPVVFRLTPQGALSEFTRIKNDGLPPHWSYGLDLAESFDGGFVGLAASGYDNGGYLFKVPADGQTSMLRYVRGVTGRFPTSIFRGFPNTFYVCSPLGGGTIQPDGRPSGGGVISKLGFDGSPSPFEQWLTANGIASGPDGDDDGDGLNNLLEYASGLDPRARQGGELRVKDGQILSLGPPRFQIGDDGTARLTYARRKGTAGMNMDYVVMYGSPDDFYPNLSAGTVIASNAGMEVVSVSFYGSPERAFAYLLIQQP